MGYSYLRILVLMNVQQTNESTYIALLQTRIHKHWPPRIKRIPQYIYKILIALLVVSG